MPHRSVFSPPLASLLVQDAFQPPPMPTTKALYAPPPAGTTKPANRAKEVFAAIRAATSLSHAPLAHYTTTSMALLPKFGPMEATKSCKFVEKHHRTAPFDHTTTNAAFTASPKLQRAHSSLETGGGGDVPGGVYERARPIIKAPFKGLLEHATDHDTLPFLTVQASFEALREHELDALRRAGAAVRPLPCIPHQEVANPIGFVSMLEPERHRRSNKHSSRRSDKQQARQEGDGGEGGGAPVDHHGAATPAPTTNTTAPTARTNTSLSEAPRAPPTFHHGGGGMQQQPHPFMATGGHDAHFLAGANGVIVTSYQQAFRARKAVPVGRVLHTVAFLRKQQEMSAAASAVPAEEQYPRHLVTTNQAMMFPYAGGA